jgi:hypothetical protein
MNRKDIEEVVLRPMQRTFLPPRHLRYHNPDDPDAKEEALEQYYQALAAYDRETLEKAWRKVRAEHDFSIWPTPAKLVQAAELFLPRPRPPSEAEQRRQRAWESAEEYANRFMKRRQLAKLARRDGWAGRLRVYVQGAAWVQAQLIEGLEKEGIGLPTELTHAGAFRSSGEALSHFQKAFRRQVEEGEIDVSVPKGLVEHWKQEAAVRGPAPPSPALEALLEYSGPRKLDHRLSYSGG